MAGDWVKLHRSILNNEIIKDPALAQVWMWCLVKSNYRASTFRGETINPGQFVTGRQTASMELNMHPSKFYRILNRLKTLGCLSLKSNSLFTVVSICNWETYQTKEERDRTAIEQPSNSDRTAIEQPSNTIEEGKKERSKEGKKNSLSSVPPELFVRFWEAYPKKTGKPAALKRWQKFPDAIHQELLTAVNHYSKSQKVRDGFIKDPVNFFKDEFWKDYLEPPPAGGYPSGPSKPSRNGAGQLFDATTVNE